MLPALPIFKAIAIRASRFSDLLIDAKNMPLPPMFPSANTGAKILASAAEASARGAAPANLDEAAEFLFEAASTQPGLELLPWLEKEFTRRAMEATGQNQVRASKMLGITRATLRKRLEHLRSEPA